MSGRSKDWRRVCELARLELDPARQLNLCDKARRLMQTRMLDLASGSGDVEEQDALEEALRDLWVIEQGIRNPDLQ
jgi:hypothetical protein